MRSLTVSAAPVAEPVTLGELKAHLRVDGDDDDDLIAAQGRAAREWVEAVTGRQLVAATLAERYDDFPRDAYGDDAAILLSRAPVRAVDGITYVDTAGAAQTWAPSQYQADTASEPARIRPAHGVTYPGVRSGQLGAVVVTYSAGYAPDTSVSPADPAGNVPAGLKAAIKLLVGHWYEHRMAVTDGGLAEMPSAVRALVTPYRMWPL